jgi:hypothetical protein
MGSDRAKPGAANPNGPNGGPQAVEQKYWPERPLIYYNRELKHVGRQHDDDDGNQYNDI